MTAAVTGAVCGAVLVAAPAHAEVTVTPDRAVQGGAAKLTFRVTEERADAYTTKIEILFPESAPIAEVWPLTVPDWAPAMSLRKLDRPLSGLHHGRVTEVTSRITWVRAASAKPADAAELMVSLGPMPETDRLVFTVIQTYSDGTVVRWNELPTTDGSRTGNQAVVVNLTAPTAAPAGADGAEHGSAHGGAAATNGQPVAPDQAADGGGLGSLTAGLLIGLLVGGGVAVWLARVRRGRGPDHAEESAAPQETVPARRAWRLRE